MAAPIHTFDLELPHGITLACRACETAPTTSPRALFLHGFPEAAFVWDEVMGLLADDCRSLAPNLRGYAGSSAPADVEAYRPKALVADIVALIEATAGPMDLLVAHDWGGAVAWNLASQRPDLFRRLVILNSPHPATFLRDLQHDEAQQKASAYMRFLCRPDAQPLLQENGYERLWQFFHAFGQGGDWLTPALRAQYEQVWSRGLTGPLNYYRASPLKPPADGDDEVMRLTLPPGFGRVERPTLVLWGDADRALLPGLLDGLAAYLPRHEIVRVPGASHWIVHERPTLVAEQLRRWLALAA